MGKKRKSEPDQEHQQKAQQQKQNAQQQTQKAQQQKQKAQKQKQNQAQKKKAQQQQKQKSQSPNTVGTTPKARVSSQSSEDASLFTDVAIFWDYKTAPLSPHQIINNGSEAACRIRDFVQTHFCDNSRGGIISQMRVYVDAAVTKTNPSPQMRSDLGMHGFDIVDATHDSTETRLVVDIMTYVWDTRKRYFEQNNNGGGGGGRPTTTCCCGVVLITSEGSYAYLLSRLKHRGVGTMLFTTLVSNNSTLQNSAERSFLLGQDVLRCDAPFPRNEQKTTAIADDALPPLMDPVTSSTSKSPTNKKKQKISETRPTEEEEEESASQLPFPSSADKHRNKKKKPKKEDLSEDDDDVIVVKVEENCESGKSWPRDYTIPSYMLYKTKTE